MSWIVDEGRLGDLSADALSSVFTVGNGRVCTRGTPPDAFCAAEAPFPFRGTYLAGVFTRAGWGMDYLMGGPDWTAAAVAAGADALGAVSAGRALDLRAGVLTYTCTFTCAGSTVHLAEQRFASWAEPFCCAQRITVRIEGDRGVVVTIGIDGDVRSSPAKYYKPGIPPNCDERGVRLSAVETVSADGELLRVVLKARATPDRTAAAAVVRQVDGPVAQAEPCVRGALAAVRFALAPSAGGGCWVFEKVCAVSGDVPGFEEALADERRVAAIRGASFDAALAAHRSAMEDFWRVADVRIAGDELSQLAVRYAVWSTRIAAPLDGGRSSIGPKNLTGDWYQGGVFWDMDLYQAPLLAAVAPRRARNHVRYRANHLPAARSLAAQDGYDGARYPFTSHPDGGLRAVRFGGPAREQLHVNADVAWAICHTAALAGDDLLLEGGLEVLLDLSRFWLSFIPPADASGVCHVRNICGPDELHPGVDDNTYTNVMVAHMLTATAEMVERLSEAHGPAVARIAERVGYGPATAARARQVAAGLCRPLLPDAAPAQFAGFEAQPEPNVAIRNRWGAGDKTNKQADALMLAQALPRQTDPDWLARAYDQYAPLCTQTSSLSPSTHVIAAVRLRRRLDAQRFWALAAGADLKDTFGNAAHGIHGAGQGGVWMAAAHGFGGLQVGLEGVALDPLLHPDWEEMGYGFLYRGGHVSVRVRPEGFTVTNRGTAAVPLTVGGRSVELPGGQRREFPVTARWREPCLRAVLLGLGELSPALADLLGALAGKGIKAAVAWDNDRARQAVERAHLADLVDAVADGGCITAGKPDPQVFAVAAQRCRVLPWECLGIDDTADGVEAIRRSGAVSVGVGAGGAGADCRVGSPADLSLDVLLRAFAEHESPVNPFLALNVAKMKSELAE